MPPDGAQKSQLPRCSGTEVPLQREVPAYSVGGTGRERSEQEQQAATGSTRQRHCCGSKLALGAGSTQGTAGSSCRLKTAAAPKAVVSGGPQVTGLA